MVNKLKKILVPLDGSPNSIRGLENAISIAKQCGSSITGFYVHHLPFTAGIKYTKSMKKEAQAKATKIIGTAMQRVERNGVSYQYKTSGGHTGRKIVDCAHNNKFDMIVIGARGLGGAKEAFLGSVSNFVMHKSNVPVLIVR